MTLPSPVYSDFAIVQYGVLLYILVIGFLQYYKSEKDFMNKYSVLRKSLIPVGAIAAVLGFMAMTDQIREVFDAIQAAGDISPGLVSGGISLAYPHLTLGLLSLIISLLFHYFNRK